MTAAFGKIWDNYNTVVNGDLKEYVADPFVALCIVVAMKTAWIAGSFFLKFGFQAKNILVEPRQEMAFIDMTSSAGYSVTHKHKHTRIH